MANKPNRPMPRTLVEKIWEEHSMVRQSGGDLLYVDLHLVHEVTSPQAFEGLRNSGRKVRRPSATLAVADHGVPTDNRKNGISDELSRLQIQTLKDNCHHFGIRYFDILDPRQGIVHVVGPEQGLTQPGMVIVCGDSHTSTHGAFGALAFGIGTSEVEHVLATQTLRQAKPKTMRISVNGKPSQGVTAKDLILGIIGKIGAAGGTGYVVEYGGDAIKDLSMSGRMSICNMSIEAGARAGLVAPDKKTEQWLRGRPFAPVGKDFDAAAEWWRSLPTDSGATYDKEVELEAAALEPQVTWGTSPQDVVGISGVVPNPKAENDPLRRATMERSLEYMGLTAGTKMTDIEIDRIFLGSCTNARVEDLQAAARLIKGAKIAPNVSAMVVPGSGLVKQQAEEEGLAEIFTKAGFEWREPGCSMCLGMNPDQLRPKERCVSTSNRNFEGRQGRGGRTHLVSPIMAAAAALKGKIADVRDIL